MRRWYDPFGQALRATGPMARENPFRFSTKRTDNATDLVLYEYRPYGPTQGRWLSRDPMREGGGLNLYTFVGDNPIAFFDARGLKKKRCGVQEFVVHWTKGGSNPLAPYSLVHIEFDIKFKRDEQYDPRCCEFRLMIGWKWIRLRDGRTGQVSVLSIDTARCN